jgi:apolipoprotein N-acyltransferase
MFSDSFAAEFDLASAQFRAAENNVAIVRANRFGPSGFIASDGRIIRKTSYDADGATIENVPYEEEPRRTLYSLTGDTLFVLGGVVSLLIIAL